MLSTYHIYVMQILDIPNIHRFIYMLRGWVAELWIKTISEITGNHWQSLAIIGNHILSEFCKVKNNCYFCQL